MKDIDNVLSQYKCRSCGKVMNLDSDEVKELIKLANSKIRCYWCGDKDTKYIGEEDYKTLHYICNKCGKNLFGKKKIGLSKEELESLEAHYINV